MLYVKRILNDRKEARVKKTGRAKPLFLAAAPAGRIPGTIAETFPAAHH